MKVLLNKSSIIKFVLKKHSLTFHIIATFFTLGIWIIIYLSCKIKYGTNNSYYGSFYENKFSFEELFGMNRSNYDKATQLNREYSQILSSHYNYTEKIGMAYTIANNLSSPFSNEMEKVIQLCLSDIDIAPQFSEYCKKMAKLYGKDEYITNYPSFKTLAIIYEKRKDYSNAINVCKAAISLGFYRDNTTGQMPGRLARLIKKDRNEKLKLNN